MLTTLLYCIRCTLGSQISLWNHAKGVALLQLNAYDVFNRPGHPSFGLADSSSLGARTVFLPGLWPLSLGFFEGIVHRASRLSPV